MQITSYSVLMQKIPSEVHVLEHLALAGVSVLKGCV